MEDLPTDCLRVIFGSLDTASIVRSAAVNREWSGVSREPQFYQHLTFDRETAPLLSLPALLQLLRHARNSASTNPAPRSLSIWRPDWPFGDSNSGATFPSATVAAGGAPPRPNAARIIVAASYCNLRGNAGRGHFRRTSERLLQELGLAVSELTELRLDDSINQTFAIDDAFCKGWARVSPSLESLSLSFVPYSPGSNALTDDGLIAFLEKTPNLKKLLLRGCTSLSDRTLLALGSLCPHLTHLELHGFSDLFHSWALESLFRSCKGMRTVRLDSRLIHVGDEVTSALGENLAQSLEAAALPSKVTTDAAVHLARLCPKLRELDVSGCRELRESPERTRAFEEEVKRTAPWLAKVHLPKYRERAALDRLMSSPIDRHGAGTAAGGPMVAGAMEPLILDGTALRST